MTTTDINSWQMFSPTIIPSDNPNIKKGLYVSLACTHCRANHRRCNGEAPCSRCTKLNLECIYTKTRPRGGLRVKKNTKDNNQVECTNAVSCSESGLVLVDSTINFKMLLNFYTGIYNQTADYRMCPIALPNPDNLSASEHKFRVLSCIGYAALTLGHRAQGQLFVEQAKQYVPQAMSSVTLEAALGFYHLGLSHLMDQDNATGVNYLKVCKSITSTVYNTQRSQGKVDLFVTGPYEAKPTLQSVVLKLLYYYAVITAPMSFKSVQKKLNSLTKLTNKIGLFHEVLNLTSIIINIRFFGTEEEVLTALNSAETLASNPSDILMHTSLLYTHMFRAMKFAFLQDYLAMNEECDRFISLFKSLQVHDLTTTKVAWLATYLWSSFDVPNFKIQELVTHAHQLSVNFPGYKALSTQHTKYQDPLGMLLERRLTCSEESMTPSNVVDPFANADVPLLDDSFIFDELLEVTF